MARATSRGTKSEGEPLDAARRTQQRPFGSLRDATNEPPAPAPLDALDEALARLVEADDRMSHLEMAQHLGVARATISERLARLVEGGVITGFHAHLDYRRLGYPILAFVGVQIDQSRLGVEIFEALGAIVEVEEIHAVTGQVDLLLKMRARSTEHLMEALVFKVQAIPGIGRGETMLVMASPLEWAPVGVPRETAPNDTTPAAATPPSGEGDTTGR